MPTVAEQLRAAREAKRLTVQQIADATKIRTDHIRALEDGNFNAFSAPIYIRGSVKNYAALLKLDIPKILAELDAELMGTEKFSEPPPLVEESNTALDRVMFLLSKLNWKMGVAAGVVVCVVLILVLAGAAWHHYRSHHSAPKLPPAVYQSSDSGETLPLHK
jgi:cytoskeleton protein RodZ